MSCGIHRHLFDSLWRAYCGPRGDYDDAAGITLLGEYLARRPCPDFSCLGASVGLTGRFQRVGEELVVRRTGCDLAKWWLSGVLSIMMDKGVLSMWNGG